MKNKSKGWIVGFIALVISILGVIGKYVIKVDPFFHYHKPDTDKYYYTLNNQRSQNDGIMRTFEYDAIITGTSMTENFKTSEMDEMFGTKSIKIPYEGATFKEVNDALGKALSCNSDVRIIIRGLDMAKIIEDKNAMREDLGEFPTYLYDNKLWNDVEYIFNRDVIFERVYPMLMANDKPEFSTGITSFDEYSNWMSGVTFGIQSVRPDGIGASVPRKEVHLTEEEKELVLGNIRQNIISLAKEHQDVTFYYFFTPYSILWWQSLVEDGTVYKQVEAEELVIQEVLKTNNIKLFSFNNLIDIVTDINNYKDEAHYGAWINSLMLTYMKEGKC